MGMSKHYDEELPDDKELRGGLFKPLFGPWSDNADNREYECDDDTKINEEKREKD